MSERDSSREISQEAREFGLIVRDVCDATVGGDDHLGCKCDSLYLRDVLKKALTAATKRGFEQGREKAAKLCEEEAAGRAESFGDEDIETPLDDYGRECLRVMAIIIRRALEWTPALEPQEAKERKEKQ